MRKLWVAMMSLGLAGGLAFAEEPKTDDTQEAERKPGAAGDAKNVKPTTVKRINMGAAGEGGPKAMGAQRMGNAAPQPECPECEAAKAKCKEEAAKSETHMATAQCAGEGCGMHHGCKGENCYANKCLECLKMKLDEQKGRCPACKAKGPGAFGAAGGPGGANMKAINPGGPGGMQKKPAKQVEETEEAPK